jgi:hypothetical protein
MTRRSLLTNRENAGSHGGIVSNAGSPADFDRYCAEHNIARGEEPAAFAAWLHEIAGWDGRMQQIEPPADEQHPVTD